MRGGVRCGARERRRGRDGDEEYEEYKEYEDERQSSVLHSSVYFRTSSCRVSRNGATV